MVGRGAQQPGHLLHPEERRRDGGQGLRSAVREVPQRPARRARGVEVGMVGLQERRVCRHGAHLRGRRAVVPTLGLPAAVPLLVGALARQARRRRGRRVAAPARGDRLRQFVLWPSRRTAPVAERPDDAHRRCRACGATVGRGAPSRAAKCGRDPAPARQRSLRRCVERAPLRAAHRRIVAGRRRDDRVGVSPEGRVAAGHHADAARVPAASDRRSGSCRGKSCRSSSR